MMEWEFSREPMTLSELIDCSKLQRGDWEAMFRLIRARLVTPNVSDAEIKALRLDLLQLVIERMSKGLSDAANFRGLVDRLGLQ